MSTCHPETDDVSSIFVYGTLKSGYGLSHVWPNRPKSIVLGRIAANLLNLGPYPGAIEGTGFVLGELWRFDLEEMAAVLKSLDEAEEFYPCKPAAFSLYVRKTVQVITQVGELKAFAYFLAHPDRFAKAPEVQSRESFLGENCQTWKGL